MSGADISVVVVTKNEERNIARCLGSLSNFDDVWVVDSGSSDRTCEIAREYGARVVDFVWDGAYPKKRQWCLENLDELRDWVLWIDADEVMSSEAAAEILVADLECHAGYYLRGRYVFGGRALRFGLRNNKLAFFDRRKVGFPVVDDLDIEGMGEIEGHYQPVVCHISSTPLLFVRLRNLIYAALLMPSRERNLFDDQYRVGQLSGTILHHAYDENWLIRHQRYATWQAAVWERGALPEDGRFVKRVFLRLPFKGVVAFFHSYVFKFGFLDGWDGFRFAKSRWVYYRLIQNECKILKSNRSLEKTS